MTTNVRLEPVAGVTLLETRRGVNVGRHDARHRTGLDGDIQPISV